MPLTDAEVGALEEYRSLWWATVRELAAEGPLKGTDWKSHLPAAPIELMKRVALEHPDGAMKRLALNILDHDANDESTDVFRQALADPSPKTRMAALHGLACERCRVGELCVDDVVPTLIDVLERDESPKVRQAAVGTMLLLAGRDERVPAAFGRAAADDADPYVREAAAAARDGNWRGVKSRKAMRRRARRQSRRETQVGVGALGE